MVKTHSIKYYSKAENKDIIDMCNRKENLDLILKKTDRSIPGLYKYLWKLKNNNKISVDIFKYYSSQYYDEYLKKTNAHSNHKNNNDKGTLEGKVNYYLGIHGDTHCNSELIRMILRSVINPHLNKGEYSSIIKYKEEIKYISEKHRKIVQSSDNKYNTDITYLANIASKILSHENCDRAAKKVLQFFNLSKNYYDE